MRHGDMNVGLWCACSAYGKNCSSAEPFSVQLPEGASGEAHECCSIHFRSTICDQCQQVIWSAIIAEEEFSHAQQGRCVWNPQGIGNDGVLVRCLRARHVEACKARAASKKMAGYPQVAWLRPCIADPARKRGLHFAPGVGGVDRTDHPIPCVALALYEFRPSQRMLLDAEVLIQKLGGQVGLELAFIRCSSQDVSLHVVELDGLVVNQ